ncbi:hypothetical protein DID78_02360 [Candidatus Marinamargulisbacteria bacterium SCGC AG-343-D04]|nr:hypothetical protein DID78_02360 [Candidatus Marinamargulisbacteria bacterium SCGC AG-343-D04]
MATIADKLEVVEIEALDEEALIQEFGHLPGFCVLDSSDEDSKWSVYQIMVCDPFITISTSCAVTTIVENNQSRQIKTKNPFDILQDYVEKYAFPVDNVTVPFVGGGCGIFIV